MLNGGYLLLWPGGREAADTGTPAACPYWLDKLFLSPDAPRPN